MRYAKVPLSVSDQAQRLLERGLSCDRPERLRHYLSHIGYYRLSAYWLPFEYPPTENQRRNHLFLPETTFDAVLNLYIFDRKLRLLVMDAIEYLMHAINPRGSWKNRLLELLKVVREPELRSMGFPDDWRSRSPWKDVSP